MDIGVNAVAGLGGGVIVALVFLLGGLAVLVKGADVFVEHASAAAARFEITAVVIDLHRVYFGELTEK